MELLVTAAAAALVNLGGEVLVVLCALLVAVVPVILVFLDTTAFDLVTYGFLTIGALAGFFIPECDIEAVGALVLLDVGLSLLKLLVGELLMVEADAEEQVVVR